MVGSVTKSNSSRSDATATPRRRKKSFTWVQSSRRKSKQRGWSRSTDWGQGRGDTTGEGRAQPCACVRHPLPPAWDTSMITSRPSWYRILYSLRSACTRRHTWQRHHLSNARRRHTAPRLPGTWCARPGPAPCTGCAAGRRGWKGCHDPGERGCPTAARLVCRQVRVLQPWCRKASLADKVHDQHVRPQQPWHRGAYAGSHQARQVAHLLLGPGAHHLARVVPAVAVAEAPVAADVAVPEDRHSECEQVSAAPSRRSPRRRRQRGTLPASDSAAYLSLNTRIEVLYTLTASWVPPAVWA